MKFVSILLLPVCSLAFSPLQKIITSEAFVATLASRIGQEIFSDNIILQEFTAPHSNIEYLRSSSGIGSSIYCANCLLNSFKTDLFYIFILGGTFYMRYFWEKPAAINKLADINVFLRTQRATRFIILVFLFIFTKDINNAI